MKTVPAKPEYMYGVPQIIFGFFLGVILAPYSLGFILFLGYILASAAYYLIFNNTNFIIEGGAFCGAIFGYVFGRLFVLSDANDDPFTEITAVLRGYREDPPRHLNHQEPPKENE